MFMFKIEISSSTSIYVVDLILMWNKVKAVASILHKKVLVLFLIIHW